MTKIQKLPLTEHMAQAVCFGAHQTSIRIGREYAKLQPGPAAFVMEDSGKIIPVTIKAVVKKPFGEINDADGAAHNMSAEDLKYALKQGAYAGRRITDRTPVYVLTLDAPTVTAEITAILSTAQARLAATSDRHALSRAEITFTPDYKLNAKGGVVEDGAQGRLCIGHLKRSASNALAALFEKAVGKAGIGIESDRGRFFTLSVQGDMAKIHHKLQEAFAVAAAAAPAPQASTSAEESPAPFSPAAPSMVPPLPPRI